MATSLLLQPLLLLLLCSTTAVTAVIPATRTWYADHPAAIASHNRMHPANAGAVVCNVEEYGAVGDNSTLATAAFAAAISDCHAKSPLGSVVLVPNGTYRTGAFNLTSNMTLYLSAKSTLVASTNPDDYPQVVPLPLIHHDQAQYSALIGAYDATNVIIGGEQGAVVEGLGWNWWYRHSSEETAAIATRPPKLIEMVSTSAILIANVTVQNSPMWTIHVVYCDHVEISHVHTYAPRYRGGTDGIDPDSSTNVYIHDCLSDVGDDAMSVKSYGNIFDPSKPSPAVNILFERVTIVSRNFAIGGSVSAGVNQVTFRDSVIGVPSECNVPWAIKIKTNSDGGHVAQNILFENVRIGNVGPTGQQPKPEAAIIFQLGYDTPVVDPATIRNVTFRNVTALSAVAPGRLTGLPKYPIKHVTWDNVNIPSKLGWACNWVQDVVATNVTPPVYCNPH